MIKINKKVINLFIEMFENTNKPLKFPEIVNYFSQHGVKIGHSDIRKVLHLLERYKVIAIFSPMTGYVSENGYETYIYTPHHYVDYLKKRLNDVLPSALKNVEFVLKCNDCGSYILDYTVTKCPVCNSPNLTFVNDSEILKLPEVIDYSDFYELFFIELEKGLSGVLDYLLKNKHNMM